MISEHREFIQGFGDNIWEEMHKAYEKYGPYNSTHEVYAVLKEELEEYWELVKKSKQDGFYIEPMKKELLQIASVALRAIDELEENEIRWV